MSKDRIQAVLAGAFVSIAIIFWTSFSFKIETDYFEVEYTNPSEKEIAETRQIIL